MFVLTQNYLFAQLTEEKVFYDVDAESVLDEKVFKNISISFDCCFEDSAEIFLDNQFLKKVYLKTDESTGTTDVEFNVPTKNKILKITLPNQKVFCQIKLEINFKLLYINYLDDIWKVYYTNTPKEYE